MVSEISVKKMSGQAPSHSFRPQRRKRKLASCENCRHSKLRCDRQHPCGSCKRRRYESSCSFQPSASASMSAIPAPSDNRASNVPSNSDTSPVARSARSRSSNVTSAALPPGVTLSSRNQASPDTNWESILQRPAPDCDVFPVLDMLSPYPPGPGVSLKEILEVLPPKNCCDYIVSHFFIHLSPLFPILHGPTFQAQYTAFLLQPYDADLSWLALLFSICSLVLYAMEPSDPRLADLWKSRDSSPTEEAMAMSRRLLQTAMTCLSMDQFFVRHKLSTFEALLMVIYHLSHNESVDQGWALLGMALNIGIALRCNVDTHNLNPVETERRRRCWAGVLTLHTYQAILFRDIDMSFLLNIKTTMPANVNDSDITGQGVLQSSSKPTHMSVMISKVRLFRISAEICHHISSPSRLDPILLKQLDEAIRNEQQRWDLIYMKNGSPSILDASFAHWCVLQTYAHHLYLLLHRPFHHSQKPCFIPSSRQKCITSAVAMISIHRQLYEVPLLRGFYWLLNGVTSLKALHAAVALNSCLLDMPSTFDTSTQREELEKLTIRMEALSHRSTICKKANHILRHLQ